MNKLSGLIDLGPKDGIFSGPGPLGKPGSSAPELFSKIISSMVGLLTIIAGIWFVILFITGAIGIISSGGDKAKVETATKRLQFGIIGIVVVIAGIFLIDFIGSIVGFDILNFEDSFQRLNDLF